MELFEQIRREYKHGVGTIKGVALKFGVHRRMVREAIGSAVPQIAEGGQTGEGENGSGDSLDRRDSGSRPESPSQAAAYRAPNLVPPEGREARGGCGGVNRTAVRAKTEDRAGSGTWRGVHCANLPMGPGRSGRLV